MGISGDFGQIKKLQNQFKSLEKDGKNRVIRACAEEGRFLVERGFESGKSPDGAPWAPVQRGGQPLRDTGRLLASLNPTVYSTGFKIETNLVYASVHQFGATIRRKNVRSLGAPKRGFFGKSVTIAARPYLPQDQLPTAWRDQIVEAASDAVNKFFP